MSVLSQTSSSDWKYIAEGGSSIVFSYSGPRNVSLDGTVLRLRKSRIASASSTVSTQTSDDPAIDFQEHVIKRVIPSHFLPRLETIEVERDWLETMVAAHDSSRPMKRREKDQIDLTRTKAILAPDLIGNHGWAIEIKPKWGFLPEPAHLSEYTRPLKTRICRFCMNKNTVQRPFKLSYCPLDLYSEFGDRLRTALYALWDDWVDSQGTRNNLRIFVNGKILDPSSDSCAATLSREINLDKGTMSDLREKFATVVSSILLEHPVLSTLSDLQRLLDPLDIEGLSRLTSDTRVNDYPQSPLPLPTGSLIVDPDLREWSSFLAFASSNLLDKNQLLDHTSPDTSHRRNYILAYLLSATFKDCSIIIHPRGDNAKDAAVTIIDLDAKSLKKLGKWEALDRKVVLASTADTRICIDKTQIAMNSIIQQHLG